MKDKIENHEIGEHQSMLYHQEIDDNPVWKPMPYEKQSEGRKREIFRNKNV